MSGPTSADERKWTREEKMLHDIKSSYAKDAYRTPGKAPVMSRGLWEIMENLAQTGWITLDQSEMPMLETPRGVLLGYGFVSLTEEGERALTRAQGGPDHGG